MASQLVRTLPWRALARNTNASCRTYATVQKVRENVSTKNKTSTATGTVTTPSAEINPLPMRRAANTAQIMRTYKPRTPGQRHLKRAINDHLWKGKPYRKLTFAKKGQGRGGRNRLGRVTVRHRGGGHARRIRTVDFSRMVAGKQTVDRIEYDPNRTAHIALVTHTVSGEKSYIIAAEGMRAGDTVESFRAGIPEDLVQDMGGTVDPGMLAVKTAFRGNCLPVKMIPMGSQVYNIGSTKGKGAVFCRSAGTYGIIVQKEERGERVVQVTVKLQSGEVRRVDPEACATIGVVSNPHYQFEQLGKAGRSRWLGIRPTVRGVAMNSVDHPLGGGRGKTKGNRIPCSPWGQQAKSGFKTRKRSNVNKWVVQERPRNHGKRRSKN